MHYDSNNAWLYLDWKGPQSLKQVQADCQCVTELIAQTHSHKALNDNSHTTETSWEMVMWVAKEYRPWPGTLGWNMTCGV